VRPPARFGELKLNKNTVSNFDEKNQIKTGWINGGFFVFNKSIFNFIPKKNTMLERDTMKNLTLKKQLIAYKHEGFWQCMDTLRDKDLLNKKWKKNKNLW
jgi:glucose-1-phosphate cytidylyltransferase